MSAVLEQRPLPDLAEVACAVDPQAFERARRVLLAMTLLRSGMTRREISGIIQRRFGVSQPAAWITVDMAVDMAGPL